MTKNHMMAKGLRSLLKCNEANTLVNGTNNAYVDMELTVKVDDTTTYTYKFLRKQRRVVGIRAIRKWIQMTLVG